MRILLIGLLVVVLFGVGANAVCLYLQYLQLNQTNSLNWAAFGLGLVSVLFLVLALKVTV